MRAVFLGATKGMGRALARKMAANSAQLFLLGRDEEDLMRSARDLEARGAEGRVGVAHCDLLEPKTLESAIDIADQTLGGFDTAVITAGLFATQADLEKDFDLCDKLLTANFTRTVQFCEAARKRLLQRGGGTLCAFSSVAGDRARKPVILYGASKAGLSYYMEGLDHKFRAQGLRVILIKPGFVKTGMTEGLDPPPFAGDPEEVAEIVWRSIQRGRPVTYAPRAWRCIMMIIRWLPRAIMRRIQF